VLHASQDKVEQPQPLQLLLYVKLAQDLDAFQLLKDKGAQ
jgi:hypothetical protein